MEDLYVVKYNSGSYDDFRVNIMFICNQTYAEKYVERFNKVLEYFRRRNEKMESRYGSLSDNYEDFWDSYHTVKEMSNAYYEPIQFRS